MKLNSIIINWGARDEMVDFLGVKQAQWILLKTYFFIRMHQGRNQAAVEMPMEIEDHIKAYFSKLADQADKIPYLSAFLVPYPGFLHTGQSLNNRLIALSKEEMNLSIGIEVLDRACKVRSKDRVPNEGRLDDKNSFRRGVIHTLN